MNSFEEYLRPTELCDFDKAPEVKTIALGLTAGLVNKHQKLNTIYKFVKELDYVYDDWYVKASDTLREKAGMCSSKTNLLVAMLRSVGIPARYRVFKVEAELMLFEWITGQDEQISRRMGEPYQEQDRGFTEDPRTADHHRGPDHSPDNPDGNPLHSAISGQYQQQERLRWGDHQGL